MKKIIENMAHVMNGQNVNVAKKMEFWVKNSYGVSFPVAKVQDLTTDTPFLYIGVEDYEGKSHSIYELTKESAKSLLNAITNILTNK